MSRVCAIHNEYCPEGACKWCEAPAPAVSDTTDIIASTISARARRMADNMARTRALYYELCLNAEEKREVARQWADAPPGGVTGSPF